MSGRNEIYTPLINIRFNFRYKNFWVEGITISKSSWTKIAHLWNFNPLADCLADIEDELHLTLIFQQRIWNARDIIILNLSWVMKIESYYMTHASSR